jgi:hypothetical protein
MRATLRSLLAALAAAAVLAYVAAGHGLPQIASHDGMAGSTIGLCLLLVSIIGLIAPPLCAVRPQPLRTFAFPPPAAASVLPRLDARARASPRVLQRFRN